MKSLLICLLLFISLNNLIAQIVINEGSNRNYSTIKDEDGEFHDWIEIYNVSNDTINLLNYSLTDDSLNPVKWVFPNINLLPGEYKTIFCSGKNRKPISGFVHVLNTGTYNPIVGWNTHFFSNPLYWDGVSNILINICSYSSSGYTTNSVFNQTITPYYSSLFAFQDGSPYICETSYGNKVKQRPNMKFNNHIVGTGVVQNSPTDYPAPYGNWYWAAKNQMLIRGSELLASGLTAGNISSISFNVASTDVNTIYDYIDINMKMENANELSSVFVQVDTNCNLHTNFKISRSGETVYLYSPSQTLLNSLFVNCINLDNSVGSFPDSSINISFFQTSTPSATNNLSATYSGYLLAPVFSAQSGIYSSQVAVSITNPNGTSYAIRYTTDGSDPTPTSALYNGLPINIYYSSVLKARAFGTGILPSPITVASYLLGVNHVTPVLSVVTSSTNLYGATGIFDNFQFDWEKAAYVEYFDSTQQLIFSQRAGMQIDGGAGGSRSNPQHSFRVELDNSVLGDGPINYQIIPNKPYRMKYSTFYLRNGSNQYLNFPYKDACEVETMGGATNNYYSGWRPVSVYINGAYFGLYELREKIDLEYFETKDNAIADSTDILTLSYWNGSVLRALEGSVDSFYTSYAAFNSLSPADTGFWRLADNHFDMTYYNDYIIAQSWIGDTDWPYNNIKIYRSDKTDYRWRFCLTDLELSLNPNGWTDCYFDHIHYMLTYDASNPYMNIWLKGMQNDRFKNYFINRFADVMNTSYLSNRILPIENSMFGQTVMEMQKEYLRWGDPNNISQQMIDFNNSHQTFQTELASRTTQVRNHIQSNFSLAGQVDVTLNVFPTGAGKIKISTIIPTSLPWTGVYFNGNPVIITAYPNPGYTFAYWDPNAVMSQSLNPTLNLNIFADATFNAVFTASQFIGKLCVSELNYHSDSTRTAGDWIEFHNYGTGQMDISGWRFTDSIIFHNYIFPNGTIIQPGGYIVLAEDTLKFHTQHPSVQVLGPAGFGFSNSDESMTVLDFSNTPILTFHYDDSIPWPQAADGLGRTLELVNDTLNPALPESWFAGCIGGSPGGPYVPCTEDIIFSEINYKSSPLADAGDWVEIHNIGTDDIDISGWKFRDGDNAHTYTFPAGTILTQSGYLVLFSDLLKFGSLFQLISNITGPFTFGLGSTGEAIRLFDASGRLYQSVVYDETSPWPQGAVGNGYTLELIDVNGNFCDGTNWMDGCYEGSPGSAYFFPCLTNVDLLSSSPKIKVFPNPSNGKFTVYLEKYEIDNSIFEIEIFNVFGEKVYSKSYLNQQMPIGIDLSNSSNGVYFLKINNAGKILTSKIVISDF